MELTNVARPLWPDVQELRMLRALVREGIAASWHGSYAVQFHGWHIRVRRFDNVHQHSVHIEIRCPGDTVCACFARGKACYVDGEVA